MAQLAHNPRRRWRAATRTWSKLPKASRESILTGSTVTPSFILAGPLGALRSTSCKCVFTGLPASDQSGGYSRRYENSASLSSVADAGRDGASSAAALPIESSAARRLITGAAGPTVRQYGLGGCSESAELTSSAEIVKRRSIASPRRDHRAHARYKTFITGRGPSAHTLQVYLRQT